MTGERPIGWWVKRLDGLLEQVLDRAVAGDGLTRRHWQVLHALSTTALPEGRLAAVLEPFGAPVDLAPVVADLVDRGWVVRTPDGGLGLSTAGDAVHERSAARVGRLRGAVTDGLDVDDYERTVAVLARMVGNVERALATEEG